MATVTITLDSKARALLANAAAWPIALRPAILKSLDYENEITTGYIQAKRMTGTGPFPVSEGRLGVRSNRLRASLRPTKAVLSGGEFVSSIGSNVRYMGVHEYGFKGSVAVVARSGPIAFRDTFSDGAGGQVTRATLMRRGAKPLAKRKLASGYGEIRSHTRMMNIPARAPIHRGIDDSMARYRAALSRAVVDAFVQPKETSP